MLDLSPVISILFAEKKQTLLMASQDEYTT